MVVYYDLIFLLNFIYQFGVFAITNRILHIGVSNLRIIFGAVVGCIIYILSITMLHHHPVLVFLISVVSDGGISVILYRIRHIKQFVRIFLTQIVSCICLAGVLDFLNRFLGNSYLLLTGAGAVIFLALLIGTVKNMMSERMLSKNVIVPVFLKCGEKEYQTTGLIDSGNALFDPISKEPVCIMTRKLYQQFFPGTEISERNGYRVIPYRSVGKRNGIMEAFVIDAIEVGRMNESSVSKSEKRIRGKIEGNTEKKMKSETEGRKENEMIIGTKIRAEKRMDTEIYCRILFAVCPDDFTKGAGYEIILHPKILS